jgi:RNA polymerase sigma-70 factor, ECF subfamily
VDPARAEQDATALAVYLDPGRPAPEREAAFGELVARHAHRLHAVCLRVLGSHADAEDAVQETFVRLARAGVGFRGDAALSTWLYRVARNVCTDRVRHEARRPRTSVPDVAAVADPASTDEVAAADARAEAGEVGRALARLDAGARTLLLLVAVDGMSYAEAAEATGVPVGTVKSRVSRARVRLGELLAEPEPPPTAGPAPARGPARGQRDGSQSARGPP